MAKDKKLSASEKLTHALMKYRVVFLAAITIVVVGIVAIVVVSVSSDQSKAAANIALAALEAEYGTYASEADAAKRAELKKALVADLEKAVAGSSGIDGQNAHYLLAKIAQDDKDWAKAAELYRSAKTKFPSSYLSPLAAFSLPFVLEEGGKVDEAIQALLDFVAAYEKSSKGNGGVEQWTWLSPDVPHAYFSLGRLYEGKADYAKAVEAYQKLADRDADATDWTKLAKDRILQLKATGLAK